MCHRRVKKVCESVLSSMRGCHRWRRTWVSQCQPSLVLSCQPWYCWHVNQWSLGWVPRQQGEMTLEVVRLPVESAGTSADFWADPSNTKDRDTHTGKSVFFVQGREEGVNLKGGSEWACIDIWLTIDLRESWNIQVDGVWDVLQEYEIDQTLQYYSELWHLLQIPKTPSTLHQNQNKRQLLSV